MTVILELNVCILCKFAEPETQVVSHFSLVKEGKRQPGLE